MSGRWLARRMVAIVVVLFAALLINFALPRLMPGNPIDILAGGVKLTAEARQALVVQFGLDAPVWTQFWRYMINAFKGDFGLSFYYFPRPVWDVIMEALPWSLLVLLPSLALQVIIGYFLGVTAAWKVGSKIDSFLQTVSLVIFSVPLFWVAMIVLFIFSFQLGWFPLGGAFTAGAVYSGPLDHVLDIARHAVLPFVAMTLTRYAAFQLILRNTMVGVLKEQYIVTAEAKGLSESTIRYRHAARNALLPMVTFLGLSLAITIGGSVYVETIFSYPGIGKLIFDSVIARDYPVMQGSFFMFSAIVIAGNFLVDLVYMYLDPRIRY